MRASGGSFCTVSDHRVAASSTISQCSSPWQGRLQEGSSHSVTSTDFTAFLALLITFQTVSIGLNVALYWSCSFSIYSLATCCVMGSRKVLSWLHASSYRGVRLLVDLGFRFSWAGRFLLDPLSMLEQTSSGSGLQWPPGMC